MAALRLKNDKLENLCRALHKGAKVTAGDFSKVINYRVRHNDIISFCFSFSLSFVVSLI